MNKQEATFENEINEESLMNYESKGNKFVVQNVASASCDYNEKQVKDEHFDINSLKQEDIDIKIEEEEGDQLNGEQSGSEFENSSNILYNLLTSKNYKIKSDIVSRAEDDENSHFEMGELNGKQIHDEKCDSKTVKDEKVDIKVELEALVEPDFVLPEEIGMLIDNEGMDLVKLSAVASEVGHKPINKSTCTWICTNNSLEEGKVFKCVTCNYQTHEISSIKNHVRKHKPKTIACPHCPYKTNNKAHHYRHKVVHTPKKTAALYKCPECPSMFCRQDYLTRHLLVHKNPDELIWYQCQECPFKTRHKRYLKNVHMLYHRTYKCMHKCTLCPYQSRRKSNLRQHWMQAHLSKDDDLLISCPEEGCSFQSHLKSYLGQHFTKMHQWKQMFSCSECCFQTMYAAGLRRHQLTHQRAQGKTNEESLAKPETGKSSSEFNEKQIQDRVSDSKLVKDEEVFVEPLVVPPEESGIVVGHTESLAIASKMGNKRTRVLKNVPINIECPHCPYKTNDKWEFNIHKVVHIPKKTAALYKCCDCSFKSMRLCSVNQHYSLIHQ